MGKDRKKRQVGTGMKARGPQQAAEVPADLSANEGQVESLIQPILEAQDVVLTPNRVEEEIVQNLESSESALVADGSMEIEAVLDPTTDLENAMKQATEETVADVPTDTTYEMGGIDPLTYIEPAKPTAEDLDAAAEQGGYPFKPTIAELEAAIESVAAIEILPNGNVVVKPQLGEQPNGDFIWPVTVKEGYANAVREWAESDGITVEEWLSNIITQNIETYAMPAKGR